MRVLLTTPPSTERLYNLVPLAWGFRTSGHEVQIAGPPGFTPAINRTGFVAVEVGAVASADGADLLADVATVDDLADFAAIWKPGLVVWDRRAPVGLAAASAAGALSVRMLGVLDHAGRRDDPGRETAGYVTVDTTPPRLLTRPDVGELRVRHVPYSGSAVVPAWLRRKPRRPRLCVVSVTSRRVLAEVFAAVDGRDAEVMCVASAELVAPGVLLPDNVRLFDDAPLDVLLPTCTAVVHDGSAPVSATALASGLPYLDLAAEGGTTLADRIDRLMNDPAVRAEAGRARAEVQALPTPRDIVPELVAAASSGS
jgi:glycosyltransferase DesVII